MDDGRVAAIKEIRAKLGCGLREAADLYVSHGAKWRERVEEIQKSGIQYESPMEKSRDAIRVYYLALDAGEPEEQAMRMAFSKIQMALGMFWRPKGETTFVCKHCQAAVRQIGNQWHSVANSVLPQYCWVDPVHGSQLHEPKRVFP